MKKITFYLCALLFAVLFTNVSMAQTDNNARMLTDQSTVDRLNKDWRTRNQNNTNTSINWFQRGDGYYGMYDHNNTSYMTFYDGDGKHFQTYERSKWDNVPSTLRSSYDASNYKGQQVRGVWESADPTKKGYYLEVEDNRGTLSPVWVDDRGQFSDNYGTKNKSKNNPNN